MNTMPPDWSVQLEAAFPKRSGPSGWRGTRLMLAVRRALMDSTWEQIIDGCEKYKAYCQASGKEGSDFVQAPQRFIEDQSYLESFAYQVPEDPKIAEHKRKEAERWERARVLGNAHGVTPYQLESCAAYETRIMLAQTDRGRRAKDSVGGNHAVDARIASLASRMKVA